MMRHGALHPAAPQQQRIRDSAGSVGRVAPALLAAIILALLGFAVPAAAAGTTWYVDQANGTPRADCGATAGAGACPTVDAALQQAADGDIISIAAGDYQETLQLSTTVTLKGDSQDGVVIHDDDTATDPTLSIGGPSPVTVTLSTLTVRSGLQGGAAIHADSGSTVALSGVTVSAVTDRPADPAPGVFVTGGTNLTLTDSTVSDNSAGIDAEGGSTVTVDGSTFTGNPVGVQVGRTPGGTDPGPASILTMSSTSVTGSADDVLAAGVLVGNGRATLTDTEISGNAVGVGVTLGSASVQDGTVRDNRFAGFAVQGADAALDLTGTSITGNGSAAGGSITGGIAMQSSGTVTATGVTVAENFAGIEVSGGTLTLTDSAVRDNDPQGQIGGSAGGGIGGLGGAAQPQISVLRSEVTGNRFGIALDDAGARISESTVAGNSTAGILVDASDPAARGQGGTGPSPLEKVLGVRADAGPGTLAAAAVTAGALVLTNSTVVGSGPLGALATGSGGTVVLGGTIISGQGGAAACALVPGNQAPGALLDGGYTIASDGTCGLDADTSLPDTDPQLGGLADNGGPTRTMLPAAGSPAMNLIPAGTLLQAAAGTDGHNEPLCASGSTDQRGVDRPQGAGCEVGAVEIAEAPPPALRIVTATLPGGTVGEDYSEPLTGTGGNGGPYSWRLAPGSGPLPDGVQLSSDGTISGTPTADGTFAFTVELSDGVSDPVTRALSIIVAAAPVTTTTPTTTPSTSSSSPAPTSPTTSPTATTATSSPVTTSPPVTTSTTPQPTTVSTTGPTSASPTGSSRPATPPAAAPPPAGPGDAGGTLVNTGVDVLPGLLTGGLAVLVGLGLMLAGRRRPIRGDSRG